MYYATVSPGAPSVKDNVREKVATDAFILLILDVQTLISKLIRDILLLLEVSGDKVPDAGCEGEADRGEEERVVVSDLLDDGSGGEGACGTGDLVADVYDGVHATELHDMATNNVSWDDTADELNHAVNDTSNSVDAIVESA